MNHPHVIKAMEKEIGSFQDCGAFEPIEQEVTVAEGYTTLSATWVPSWDEVGDVKMRYCSREFASEKRDDLFTPANTVSTERIIDIHAAKNKHRGFVTVIVDCKNAYLHAEETEKVCVEPPDVWMKAWVSDGGSPSVMWKLKKQMYGRRKASQAFNDYMAKVLMLMGFQQFTA